jgi:hypothetical protein
MLASTRTTSLYSLPSVIVIAISLLLLDHLTLSIRTDIIRNSQIKTQERRSKNVIKRNRGRPKGAKTAKNI